MTRATDDTDATAPAPGPAAGGVWKERRAAARAVKAVAALAPALVACLTAYAGGRLLPAAPNLPLGLARFGVIIVASAVAMALGRLVSRRLLPLSALLSLSLAFPDQTPKRLRTALRAPSARRLRRQLSEPPRTGTDGGPVDPTHRIIELVGAISAHHRLTRGHSERVRAYADLIAREMGLGAHERSMLTWAALLHDLGKITVPTSILDKPGRPDPSEWRVLATHPAASAHIAEPLKEWMGEWWYGIGEHHEKWNGTGYPAGLRGNEISLAGRIVAVADSFETMTATRSYKRPVPIAEARAELVRCAGSHFDPNVVRAFLNVGLGRLRTVIGVAAWVPVPLVNALQPLRDLATAGGGQVATAVAVSAGVAVGLPAVLAAADSSAPSPFSAYGIEQVAPARAAGADGGVPSSPVALGAPIAGSGAPAVDGAPVVPDTTGAAPTDPTTGEPVAAPDQGGPPAAIAAPVDPATPTTATPPGATTVAPAPTDGRDQQGTTAATPVATTARHSTEPPSPTTAVATTPAPPTTAAPTTVAVEPFRVWPDFYTVTAGKVANLNVTKNDRGVDKGSLTVPSPPSGVALSNNGNGTISVNVGVALVDTPVVFGYRICSIDGSDCALTLVTLNVVS